MFDFFFSYWVLKICVHIQKEIFFFVHKYVSWLVKLIHLNVYKFKPFDRMLALCQKLRCSAS